MSSTLLYPHYTDQPWSRKWELTPVFSPGEFHGQRSLVDYSPWESQKVRHDLVTNLPFSYGSGAPLLFCLYSFMSQEIPTFFHFVFLPSATFTVYSFILTISLQNTHPQHCPLISPTLLFSSRFYSSQSLCLLTPLAHTFRVGGMK